MIIIDPLIIHVKLMYSCMCNGNFSTSLPNKSHKHVSLCVGRLRQYLHFDVKKQETTILNKSYASRNG